MARNDAYVSFTNTTNYGSQIGNNYGVVNNHFSHVPGEQTAPLPTDLRQRLEHIQCSQETQRQSQLLASLKSEAHNAILAEYDTKIDEMVSSTGSWMWNDTVYKNWENLKHRCLTVVSGPGMGKSFLAAATIKRLKDKNASDESVAFFFVKGRDDRLRNMNEILKTMAFDLQCSNEPFRRHLLQVLDSSVSLHTAHRTWTSLYEEFWKTNLSNGRLVLIFDGLDEAAEEEQSTLGRILCSHPNPAIQFGIFGRPTLRATLGLQGRVGLIDLSAMKVGQDLTMFVQRSMKKVKCAKFASDEKRHKWESDIVTKTQGIFESARQVIDNIRSMESHDIDALLAKPLDSLNKVIELSFSIIRDDRAISAAMLKTLLTWLAYSRRSLRLCEVYEILRAQDGHKHDLLLFTLRFKLRPIVECAIFSRGSEDLAAEQMEEKSPKEWTEQELMLTNVALGHEGIRDYLRSRIAVDSGLIYPSDLADCEIVKSCFRLFRQPKSPELQGPIQYQLLYPSVFLTAHLGVLRPADIPLADVREIRKGLTWLFWEKTGNEAFLEAVFGSMTPYAFFQTWFFDQEILKMLQQWICGSLMTTSPLAGHVDPFGMFADLLQAFLGSFMIPIVGYIFHILYKYSEKLYLQPILYDVRGDDQRDWLAARESWRCESRRSIRCLYQPLRRTTACKWLTSTLSDATNREAMVSAVRIHTCALVLNILNSMHRNGSFDSSCSAMLLHKSQKLRLEANELRELAKAQNLQENIVWSINLATSMQMAGHYREALQIYHEALMRNPHSQLAVWRIAQCYADLDDFKNTSRWTEKLEEICPPSDHKCKEMKWMLSRMKGDDHQILEQSRNDFVLNRREFNIQLRYLSVLDRLGEYTEMAERVLELDGMSALAGESRPLLKLLGNYHRGLVWLFKSYASQKGTTKESLLLAVIETTMEEFRQVEPTYLQIPYLRQFNLGLYGHCDRSIVEAIQEHERLLHEASSIPLQHLHEPALKLNYEADLLDDLAHLYFDRLLNFANIDIHASGQDYVREFEKIAARIDSLMRSHVSYQGSPSKLLHAKLLYAHWLRLHNAEDKDRWKSLLREHVRESLCSLENSAGPGNLQQILSLLNILVHAGDNTRALALSAYLLKYSTTESQTLAPGSTHVTTRVLRCFRVLFLALDPRRISISASPPGAADDNNSPSSTLPSANPAATSSLLGCPVCGRGRREIVELYSCTVCYSAQYCGLCSDNRRFMYGATCPDTHSKFKIWPLDSSVENMAVEEVSGRMRVKQSWIRELKTEWQI